MPYETIQDVSHWNAQCDRDVVVRKQGIRTHTIGRNVHELRYPSARLMQKYLHAYPTMKALLRHRIAINAAIGVFSARAC